MKKILCFLYFHNWYYRKERHTCEGISSHIKEIDIQLRECKWCKKKQSYTLPKVNGHFVERNWIDTDIKPNQHLVYKRVNG
jgi:hypothetical protein